MGSDVGGVYIQIIYRPCGFLSRFIESEGDDMIPERAFVHAVTTTLPEVETIIAAQRRQPPPKARGYFEKEGVVYHKKTGFGYHQQSG